MIDLSKVDGIYLFAGQTDMRKGISGLVSIVLSYMDKSSTVNKIFIFCGRSKRSIKIIQIDYDGWWLYQKQLVNGKFNWPKENKGNMVIDKRQLQWLLDGLNLEQKNAHKIVNF